MPIDRLGSAPVPPAPLDDDGASAATSSASSTGAAPARSTFGPPGGPNGGLPDTLLQAAGATVVHGTDPGDFYCEHAFYVAGQAAQQPGTSIAKNANGEKLVGFLHVPSDDWTDGTGGRTTQAARHAGTRAVVGAALSGYYQDAAASVKRDPVKLLLTGYTRFQSVVNNPTGDFVAHQENLDAAMKAGFGAHLLTPKGRKVDDGAPGLTLAYDVRDPATGKKRTVEVHAEGLAVADTSLDPTKKGSLQHAIAAFKPNAVLCMGVAGPGPYMAEHHADDGGLVKQGRGYRHEDGAPADDAIPENYSLARAIVRGGPAKA